MLLSFALFSTSLYALGFVVFLLIVLNSTGPIILSLRYSTDGILLFWNKIIRTFNKQRKPKKKKTKPQTQTRTPHHFLIHKSFISSTVTTIDLRVSENQRLLPFALVSWCVKLRKIKYRDITDLKNAVFLYWKYSKDEIKFFASFLHRAISAINGAYCNICLSILWVWKHITL